MRAWRDGSSDDRAARAATVLPVPPSPVMTPRADSAMQWRIRATASSWGALVNSSDGAGDLPKGGRGEPEGGCQGGRGRGGRRRCLPVDMAGDPPGRGPALLAALPPDPDREQVLGPIAELDRA